MTSRDTHSHCTFIPPWLSERVDGPEAAERDQAVRARRGTDVSAAAPEAVVEGEAWTVHDARNTRSLPGAPVRSSGEPATGDVAVDEARAGIEATLEMFAEESRPRLPRRRGRTREPHRPLRPRLQQRVLGRHPAGLR